MRAPDVARFVVLAMLWSVSFVFQKVLVPVLGPFWTATLRVLIGGAALCAWLAVARIDAGVVRHWRAYLVVGTVNSAIPFVLFAFAAISLPASYLVIMNASTPMFAAVLSAVWLSDRLTRRMVGALACGVAGVTLVSRAGPVALDADVAVAIAACLAASLCYGISGVWLKRHGGALKPVAVAGWSQLFAAGVLLPVAPVAPAPVPGWLTPLVAANVLALALLCSGVAYLLYYRLIADVGPTRSMTVTFVIPAFGMLWGALFLGERVTPAMIGGAALIVAGTAVALRPPRARSR